MSDFELPANRAMPIAAAAWVARSVEASDLPAIEALHDLAFGPGALTRAAYRVRERQPRFSRFCRVLYDGDTLVAAIRFTSVTIGGQGNALLLGPLAVAPDYANQGHGRRLIGEGVALARSAGIAIIVLVGDPPYYARFGFEPASSDRIEMPGPIDPARLLVLHTAQTRAHFSGRLVGAG